MPLFGKKRQDVSGVENWNMEQLADYLNTSRKSSGENSIQYEAVSQAIYDMELLKKGNVSEARARELVGYNSRLTEACQEYIQSHKGALSGIGRDRMKVMNRLMELQKENKPVIDQMRDLRVVKEHEGKNWHDVLKPDLVARAEIGPDTKTVGANASVRYKITHNGKMGFFTAQNYAVSADVQTRNMIADTQNPEVKNLLQRNSGWLIETMRLAFDGSLPGKMGFSINGGKPTVELVNHFMTEQIQKWAGSTSPAVVKARRNLEMLKADPDALRVCTDMFAEEIKRGVGVEAGGLDTDGRSVTDRNIATSRMAALLGVDGIAAHSERMIVTKDGKQIEGCFMEFAEGLDLQSEDTKNRFEHAVVDLNAGFNRDHTTLEIFDYICAQRDRHAGNMFYKLGRPEPDGTRRVIGLQGIDNDLSFSAQTRTRLQNSVDDLHLIDEKMAERIQKLNRADLEYALGDLISEREIDALENRINALKDHMADMVKLSGDEWNMDRYEGREVPNPDDPGLSREERAYVKGLEALNSNGGEGPVRRGALLRMQLESKELDRQADADYAVEGAKDLFDEAEGKTPERKSREEVKAEQERERSRKINERLLAERAAREAAARQAQQPQAKEAAPEVKAEQKEAAPKENAPRAAWRAPEKMNVDQLAAEQKKDRPVIGGARALRAVQKEAEKKAAEIKTPEKKTPEKTAAVSGMKR